jgi:hypothetical protein
MEFINQRNLDVLTEMVVDLIQDDFEMRTDYSGRGMYGKNCIGFTTDNPTLFLMGLTAALIELGNSGEDVPSWINLRVCQDSMGLSTIVYFPNWGLDTDTDDE